MATKKFSDLTTTSTPNSASVFAIAYDSANYGVTLSNIAANMPALTAVSVTSSGNLSVSGNATFTGDVTISGDDLFMATNTSGAALIADGTNFNPVVISGDISIGTTGTAAIGTGVIVNADVNTSAAIDATKIDDGSISNTEFGYLNNVSSNIQTQLDAKASSSYVPTTITVADESSDTTCFPLFATAATGDLAPKSGSNLSFNSATGALTATSFVGTAPTPTVITVADESSDTTCFPLFVTAATGDLGPKSASGLTFNSSTDVLSGTFSGNITGNVTGNTSGTSGSTTGNAATATALETARNIGGVSFDGTGNIDLPGVNAAGNQDTSGTAADATVLETARTIGGVSFNGSANIDLPGVNTAGNQNTSGTAAVATAVSITDNESTNEDNAIIFTSGGDVDGGNIGLESDGNCTYNPSTGSITATGFIGALTGNASGSSGSCTGNAATATVLETARTIGGVSFNGSANINLPGVNTSGNQNTSGSAASLSATLAVGSGGTGATSLTANGVLIGNGTSAIASVDMSTKGKILIGDGSGNPSLLTVGDDDQVLTADSGEATGVKWAAAGGGGGGLAVLSAVNNYDSTSYYSSYSYTGFSSSYDNYLVLVHAISSVGAGEIKLEFLDDDSDLPNAAYRYAAYGKDSNGTDRILTGNNVAAIQVFDDSKTGDNTPISGYMYFHNGNGGNWDSDSTDGEGNVRPSVQWQFGGKDGNNYHRVSQGSGHYDDTAANTCNGFKLNFTANAYKVCLTIYGIKRS